MQAGGKGAGLLVRGKRSWALEGAWAFAKGREILRRTGRGAGAGKKADAAEILIRKPAWSHRLCETPAVWGSLCVRGKAPQLRSAGVKRPRPWRLTPSPLCAGSPGCRALSWGWESRRRGLSSAPVPSSLSPVPVNPPVSPATAGSAAGSGEGGLLTRAVPGGGNPNRGRSWLGQCVLPSPQLPCPVLSPGLAPRIAVHRPTLLLIFSPLCHQLQLVLLHCLSPWCLICRGYPRPERSLPLGTPQYLDQLEDVAQVLTFLFLSPFLSCGCGGTEGTGSHPSHCTVGQNNFSSWEKWLHLLVSLGLKWMFGTWKN